MDDREAVLHAFGEVIREARQDAGWSQLVLAERACMHATFLSGIERGQRNVSLLNIVALARALDQPLERVLKRVAQRL